MFRHTGIGWVYKQEQTRRCARCWLLVRATAYEDDSEDVFPRWRKLRCPNCGQMMGFAPFPPVRALEDRPW